MLNETSSHDAMSFDNLVHQLLFYLKKRREYFETELEEIKERFNQEHKLTMSLQTK